MKKLKILVVVGFVSIINVAFGFDESQLQAELEQAQNGNCYSQIDLAKYYYNQKDYTSALQWLNRVIDNPQTDTKKGVACLYLGVMCAEGCGVSKSLDNAEMWWKQGLEYEELDRRLCAYNLSWLYESTIKKNPQKAFYYRIKDADLGGYESALVVAKLYEFGNTGEKYPNVRIDYAKAIEYYEKYLKNIFSYGSEQVDENGVRHFIEKVDPLIAYKVAKAYFNGTDGVKQDYGKAAEYFKSCIEPYSHAMECRNVSERLLTDEELGDAMWNLSICYRFGRGVTQNAISAYKLAKKASEKGNQNAINLLKNNN
jgi:TPR repeat protein